MIRFLKNNWKYLLILILNIAVIVFIATQIKFKTPDTVQQESLSKVISVTEYDNQQESEPVESLENEEDAETTSESSQFQIVIGDNDNSNKESLSDYIGQSWSYADKEGSRYISLINQKVDYNKKIHVYITVECTSVFDKDCQCNDSSAWKYIPEDGQIVKRVQVECYEGENAWDAIARVLNANKIDYAYTGDPPFVHGTESISSVYGTCYLYRCNHLEAGNSSEDKPGPFGTTFAGWAYIINGVYPGLGMNGTIIRDGDEIVLSYYNGLEPFELDVEGNF